MANEIETIIQLIDTEVIIFGDLNQGNPSPYKVISDWNLNTCDNPHPTYWIVWDNRLIESQLDFFASKSGNTAQI